MIVVKIKYKGEWRKVLGLCGDDNDDTCYMVQALDKKGFIKVPRYDINISEIETSKAKRYPSGKKRLNELTQQEKEEIVARFHSGVWYLSQIADMYNITAKTVKKVVGVL